MFVFNCFCSVANSTSSQFQVPRKVQGPRIIFLAIHKYWENVNSIFQNKIKTFSSPTQNLIFISCRLLNFQMGQLLGLKAGSHIKQVCGFRVR